MTDFSHLNRYNVTENHTTEYELVELEMDGKSPTLILKPANEANKGYMNGLLRLTGKGNGRRQTKMKVNTKLMEEMRDNDKELYPSHVIVGWRDMIDSKEKAVEFSVESCSDFISVLPNWIFDGIRGHASDPENFVEVIDSEEKAKN